MALKKFRTAEQDQWGRFWHVNEDGNRIPVEPFSDDEFTGYRQIDAGSGDEGGGSSIQNAPAGLSPDAWRFQSGDVLPPEMIAQAVQSLNTPGAYVGVDGMTMDQYLADPRAAVQVENGQFVFRPEQMQGDFESIDRESFLQAAMPFLAATLPFVAGPFAASMGLFAPAAGAASAASSAAPAATSAAVDAFLNTAPMTFGQAAAPSLLSTGALASTPVSALSGLSSLLPAGGAQALMAGTGLAMASPLTGLPMAIDAAGNTLMQQIGGLAPELATMTPTSAIPATGSFSQTIELDPRMNAFEAPVDVAPPTTPTTPTPPPPTEPGILDMIRQVTQNPLYQAGSAASTVASIIDDSTPTLESLAGPVTQAGVNFSDIASGGVPSMNQSINAVTSGGGITMPSLAQTGASLGLPAGGLQSIMQNVPFTMNNPVSGLPTTMFPDGSSSVQQAGGAAPNLTTNTPTGGSTPRPTGSMTGAQTLSRLLKDQFGIDIAPGTLDLLGTGASTLLGMYGANQQARSAENLYNRFFDLGAPYRQSLANLEANPNSFYSSPMVQGALQQGSDAMARSLSAKVGNPILNPTALQEMQNYTTRGMLDAYNNRFSQLASAGQLGVSQSAPLGMQANAAQGGTANALGAGLRSVFGNQPDYTQQMLDILKNRGLGGSGTFSLP